MSKPRMTPVQREAYAAGLRRAAELLRANAEKLLAQSAVDATGLVSTTCIIAEAWQLAAKRLDVEATLPPPGEEETS